MKKDINIINHVNYSKTIKLEQIYQICMDEESPPYVQQVHEPILFPKTSHILFKMSQYQGHIIEYIRQAQLMKMNHVCMLYCCVPVIL